MVARQVGISISGVSKILSKTFVQLVDSIVPYSPPKRKKLDWPEELWDTVDA